MLQKMDPRCFLSSSHKDWQNCWLLDMSWNSEV